MSKEFYVGYLPNAPKGLGEWLKKVIRYIVVMFTVAASVFALSQEDLPGITFEYGDHTELSGYVVASPFPTLHVPSQDGTGFKSILLVNFGKFGAQQLIDTWSEEIGGFNHKLVTLKGTLIYYDGISVLELSDEESSLLSHEKAETALASPREVIVGNKTLTGEILDTKCFFGVMNPGHGKTHRSCAVRCISGGIPPIFGSNLENETFYGIVLGPNGEMINNHLLSIVGRTKELSGIISKRGDLTYFKLDSEAVELLSANKTPLLDSNLALCLSPDEAKK